MDLKSILKNSNKNQLEEKFKEFSGILKPGQAKKIKYMLNNLNDPKVKKQIENFDENKLKDELAKNPDLAAKLKNMANQNKN